MTHTDGTPDLNGDDLAELRETIDELKAIPTEELVDPVPASLLEDLPTPAPTDAVGSEKWDEPAGDDVTDL